MHISSTDDAAHFLENVISRDRLNQAGVHLVAASDGLGSPKLLDFIALGEVQTLHELFGEFDSRGGRKVHRLFGDLLEGQWHDAGISRVV